VPLYIAVIARKNSDIDETPAARPSRPSIILSALINPTIHRAVSRSPKKPNLITVSVKGIVICWNFVPVKITIKAAIN